jgi:hypothetical protein
MPANNSSSNPQRTIREGLLKLIVGLLTKKSHECVNALRKSNLLVRNYAGKEVTSVVDANCESNEFESNAAL